MDAFSLKKDNRKKFQDKQKLKRKHATPSDRKYRVLNRQKEEAAIEDQNLDQEQDQDQEQPALKSNEDRYYEDPALAFDDPSTAETNAEVNKVLKGVLRSRVEQGDGSPGDNLGANTNSALKIKDLKQMDAAELNRWLGRENKENTTRTGTAAASAAAATTPPVKNEQNSACQKTTSLSDYLPEELETDQDFLDGLL
ncbi:YER034W [Saccharomyces arboricola H-6]|uniref:YER034W n=1 Tax=Saccharomyces arboricola (strain H-6 / AS 2.3317 / CBS 10644) TaxID=1160507 RepID=J8Q302_SACAR|nr:YER034W [Saccharomyces arboricola H-6]